MKNKNKINLHTINPINLKVETTPLDDEMLKITDSMEDIERRIDEELERIRRDKRAKQQQREAATEYFAQQDQETSVEVTPDETKIEHDDFDRAMKGV